MTDALNQLTRAERSAHNEQRDGSFALLRHGGVLLRSGVITKILDGKDAEEFLAKVRNKGARYQRRVVLSYFQPSPYA